MNGDINSPQTDHEDNVFSTFTTKGQVCEKYQGPLRLFRTRGRLHALSFNVFTAETFIFSS